MYPLCLQQEPAGLSPSAAAWHDFTLLSVCPFKSGDRAGDTNDAKTYSSIMQTWLLALVVLALRGKHLFIMTLVRTLCLPHLFPDSPLVSSPPPSSDFLSFFLVSTSYCAMCFGLPLSTLCKAGELIFLGVFLCWVIGLQGALSLGMCETWYLR